MYMYAACVSRGYVDGGYLLFTKASSHETADKANYLIVCTDISQAIISSLCAVSLVNASKYPQNAKLS